MKKASNKWDELAVWLLYETIERYGKYPQAFPWYKNHLEALKENIEPEQK